MDDSEGGEDLYLFMSSKLTVACVVMILLAGTLSVVTDDHQLRLFWRTLMACAAVVLFRPLFADLRIGRM